MVEDIDTAKFDELLASGEKFVCDFYATWCGPCKMLAPVMEKVAEAHPDVKFVRVDIDRNFELAARYGIMSIPQVYSFFGGQTQEKTVGYMEEDEVEDFLAQSGF